MNGIESIIWESLYSVYKHSPWKPLIISSKSRLATNTQKLLISFVVSSNSITKYEYFQIKLPYMALFSIFFTYSISKNTLLIHFVICTYSYGFILATAYTLLCTFLSPLRPVQLRYGSFL